MTHTVELFFMIIPTITVAMLYRITVGAILEVNVGRNKKKDIESLLTVRQWLSGRYIKKYIKEYRVRYYVFMAIYYSGFVMILLIIISAFFPMLKTCVWTNSSGKSSILSIYLTVVCFMVFTIPMHILPKKAWYYEGLKTVHTFDETIERFQAAQQVWNTIPPEGHRSYRKKILNELQKRAVDMQTALMDDRLKTIGLSEETRENSVQYAWDCLCMVEEISSSAGMPKEMRKKSPVIMTYEDLRQQFEHVQKSFQKAKTDAEKSHYFESMVSILTQFAYRMKRIHQNNISVHRDDSSAIIEQYQIFQDMLDRVGDYPYKEREQDLFDSIQDIYLVLHGKI